MLPNRTVRPVVAAKPNPLSQEEVTKKIENIGQEVKEKYSKESVVTQQVVEQPLETKKPKRQEVVEDPAPKIETPKVEPVVDKPNPVSQTPPPPVYEQPSVPRVQTPSMPYTSEYSVENSITVKVKDNYYKFQLSETRTCPEGTDIEADKTDTINRLNTALDDQVADLLESLK